jgi:ABC-2 type transport system permease protein
MMSGEATVPNEATVPADAAVPVTAPGEAAGTRQRPATGWALMASELTVLYRRRRTWAMLAALAAIPILIAIAVRLRPTAAGSGRGPQFLNQITGNGLFVAVTALLVSIPLFLPLTIGVVAGDTISGEASHGTLKYLLVAPAGRVRLLVVKYVGTAVFCVTATLTVVIAGAIIGAGLFPIGPVTLLSGDTIAVGDSLVRLLLIAGFVTVSLLGLSAIGLFISTLTDVPVGARHAAPAGLAASVAVQSLLVWLR